MATKNRVLNGRIVQDTETTDANRVLNGAIFQEEAAAAPPASSESWQQHKIEQGVYAENAAGMGGVLVE